jgi:integrase
LTDAKVRALSAAAEGKRYEVQDALMPGLIVRVTDKGTKSVMIKFRPPGSKNPVRRLIGVHGRVLIDPAREVARSWAEMVRNGRDPKDELARQKRSAATERENTFEHVANDWLTRHVSKLRQAHEFRRQVTRELIPAWGDRPVTEINRDDVVRLVEGIADRGAKYVAHAVYGTIRSLFSWAVMRGTYGLKFSPCEQPPRIRIAKLIGPRKSRQRALTDAEIRAYWLGANDLGYPSGAYLKLLLLTAQRRNEVSDARWSEFNFDKALWTIPAARFKTGREVLVPLSGAAVELLKSLPRFKSGDYVFSSSYGVRPINSFGYMKSTMLDKFMLMHLQAEACERGDDADGIVIPQWGLHDLRRTARSRMSKLRIPFEVAESCLGHVMRGIHGVYDVHDYLDEKRDAFERWAAHVRSVVEPPPSNVVPLRAAE